MAQTPTAWRRADSKILLKEARYLLKRAKKKIPAEIHERIKKEIGDLADALSKKASLDELSACLQKDIDKHLDLYRKSKAREYFESILFAVLIALSLRATVIELFQIPTGSMEPTLLIGDRLFVQKFAYGLRIPFTDHYLLKWNEIERGDIVVFTFPAAEVKTQATIGAMMDRIAFFERSNGHLPESFEELSAARGIRMEESDREDAWEQPLQFRRNGEEFLVISAGMDGEFDTGDDLTNENTALPHGMNPCVDQPSLETRKNYIKRVVGVAGDRVRLENNILYINDQPAEQMNERQGGSQNAFVFAEETLPNGVLHTIAHQNRRPDFNEIVIREGSIFVMGDNRDNSSDGRCWGQVPINNVKGSAMFLLFSLDPQGGQRRDRIFTRIDP